ncbi:hypothetical protein EII17_01175 [Clostridiales bacterium COT073_COT-073]|nr:hypothetical protein EII17_01175 [Clostridiales bacterium COT073_COT-073]
MKKKIRFILIFCLSITALLGAFFQLRGVARTAVVILPDKQGNWRQVQTEIPLQADPDNLAKVMEYFAHGFSNRNIPPLFPEGLEFYSISVEDEYAVEINFKQGYLNLPDLQKGLCETAMIRTFTGFPGITKLSLYEEGIPLPTVGRSSVFGMVADDAYLSFEESVEEPIQTKEILYFYHAQSGKLVAEKKNINWQPYEPKGKAILAALSHGTQTEGLSSLLSPVIRVNEVRIRNQVCYVDFGQDLVKAYADMGATKKLFIYSIVNTLADLEKVEYVQFLINGENPEKYSETESMKALFHRNHVYVE